MAKFKLGGKPASTVEDEDDDDTASSPAVEAQTDSKPTKVELVRMAIEAGFDQPTAGTQWVKENYDVDITPTHFSASKNYLLQKSKKLAQADTPPAQRRIVRTVTAARSHSSLPADDLLVAMKELVRRYGADEVLRMAQYAHAFSL